MLHKYMRLIIATPTKTMTYEAVSSVRVPTATGAAVIRPGHAEYLTAIMTGEVLYTTADGKSSVDVTDGVCYVYQDEVRVVL